MLHAARAGLGSCSAAQSPGDAWLLTHLSSSTKGQSLFCPVSKATLTSTGYEWPVWVLPAGLCFYLETLAVAEKSDPIETVNDLLLFLPMTLPARGWHYPSQSP